jgi:hypothetical protein
VGLKSLKSLSLTNGYPNKNKNNNNKNNNNKVKSKPLELFELAGKNVPPKLFYLTLFFPVIHIIPLFYRQTISLWTEK